VDIITLLQSIKNEIWAANLLGYGMTQLNNSVESVQGKEGADMGVKRRGEDRS